MQWDDGPKAGFSTADPGRLYLPIDPDPARPTVAAQEPDPGSTLHLVRRLVALRRATPALGGRAPTGCCQGYPFAYLRDETHLVVVNPRREPAVLTADEVSAGRPRFSSGVSIDGDAVTVDGFGYAVLTRG